MTLLIAILVIIGLGLSTWWIPISVVVWLVHLFYHDDSSITNGIDRIYQKQHKTGVDVNKIKEKLKDD